MGIRFFLFPQLGKISIFLDTDSIICKKPVFHGGSFLIIHLYNDSYKPMDPGMYFAGILIAFEVYGKRRCGKTE